MISFYGVAANIINHMFKRIIIPVGKPIQFKFASADRTKSMMAESVK
jgi:heme/copper-type cytochrome/quinol oxidase subunit 2